MKPIYIDVLGAQKAWMYNYHKPPYLEHIISINITSPAQEPSFKRHLERQGIQHEGLCIKVTHTKEIPPELLQQFPATSSPFQNPDAEVKVFYLVAERMRAQKVS